MKFFCIALAVILLVGPSVATVFNRCSLAREMFRLGVPKDQLARWTCIAKHESSFNTKAVGRINKNGSRDYGIYQINNYFWCSPPTDAFSYNQCKVKCEDFLVDSIEPALKCARLVLRQQGWTAWSTFKFCKGTLPSIDDCF